MKRIDESVLEKIISEAMNEVRVLGGAKPSAQPTVQPSGDGGQDSQNVQPQADASVKKSNEKNVDPDIAYYEPIDGAYHLVLNVRWIHLQHQDRLIQKWNNDPKYQGVFKAVTRKDLQSEDGKEPSPVQFIVEEGKEDDFIAALPSIGSDIASMNGQRGSKGNGIAGYYTQKSLDDFASVAKIVAESAPTKEEIKKAEEIQAMSYTDLMTMLTSDEAKNRLSKLGGALNFNSTVTIGQGKLPIGSQLSTRTKIEVLMQLPNATFVTDAKTWFKLYGRKVVDTSQKAVITTKPWKGNVTNIEKNQAARMFGFRSYAEAKKSLDTQQIWKIDTTANKLVKARRWMTTVVYDVANTTPINPNQPDKWSTEIGLSDNLLGTPNAAALAKQKEIEDNGGDMPQALDNTPQMIDTSEDEAVKIAKILRDICAAKFAGAVPRCPSDATPEDMVAHYAAYYAEIAILPNNNTKMEGGKKLLKEAFAIAITYTFGLDSSYAARYYNEIKGLTLANRRHSGDLNDISDPLERLKLGIKSTFTDYKILVNQIVGELRKMSNAELKSGKRKPAQNTNSTNADVNAGNTNGEENDYSKLVVERAIAESVGRGESINILSLDQYMNLLVPRTLNQEPRYQIGNQEEYNTDEDRMVAESFFSMLNRMNNSN